MYSFLIVYHKLGKEYTTVEVIICEQFKNMFLLGK